MRGSQSLLLDFTRGKTDVLFLGCYVFYVGSSSQGRILCCYGPEKVTLDVNTNCCCRTKYIIVILFIQVSLWNSCCSILFLLVVVAFCYFFIYFWLLIGKFFCYRPVRLATKQMFTVSQIGSCYR